MNGSVDKMLKEKLKHMEMLRPDGDSSSLFFVPDMETLEPRIRIALEEAKRYQAQAVFFRIFPDSDGRSPIPQIYIYHEPAISIDETKYAEIHRRLWNAGVVPLVFILTSKQVRVLNCRQEPAIDEQTKLPILTPFHALEKVLEADKAFAAREIASGTIWENERFKDDFVLEKTAYFKLLDHLKSFRKELLTYNLLSEPTVNRIIVMAMLVKYLNERQDSKGNRVFEKGFLRQFSGSDSDSIESIFRKKDGCIQLFDSLSRHFNGNIFELNDREKAELSKADLSPIADFLEGDQEPTGQKLFWPLYSFEDLPVELISNIYEEFLAKEKTKTGAVYTPPILVDLLIDQCLPLDAKSISWKILDPACGSGVFLVGVFKRLIDCWRMANDWKRPTYHDLKSILKKSIYGIDKASEAILVTAFSLCVALCDELDPLIIWQKLKFDNLQDRNLQTRDFFEVVESGQFENYFDLVIGNPPFDSRLTTNAAKRIDKSTGKDRPKLPDTQLALLFLEQSLRLVRKNATVCLIQPAGPLLYNCGSNAVNFRGYMFENFSFDRVFDFTPLEEVLFPNAQVAAAAIIGFNMLPSAKKILHVTFRRTKPIKEKLLFELDPYDFHWVSPNSIKQKPYAWKANLLGGGRIHRMMDRLLSNVPTLGEYLKNKQEKNGWRFGEGYSVGCGNYLNSLPDVKELIHLSPKELKSRFKLKRTPKLAPWITGKQNVPPASLTKKGIDWNSVSLVDELFFERPRKTNQLIFRAPHVIIREKVEGSSIPAFYTEKDIVFTNQIIGLHAPENEKKYLKILAERLNDSKIFGILAILISGRILVGRKNSLYKSDIMALPYPDDMQDIDLNHWEQVLVDDIGDYLVDFCRSGENAKVLSETNEDDLRGFGEMYCEVLNPVYKQFRPLEPISIDSFICYPFCYGDAPLIKLPEKNKVAPFLDELLHRRHGSRLFINRVLRLYEQNVIFMVKPNQKRYWLRSIALRDADETLVDLLEQGY